MDEGPYRQSGAIACPRCAAQLAPDTEGRLACHAGCGGVWYPTDVFAAQLGPVLSGPRAATVWWKKKPAAACPVCRAELEQIVFATAAVQHCTKHGTWLDQGARERLEQEFVVELGRYRAIGALTAQLASRDEAVLADIATRFVDLEHRMARLEKLVSAR